MTLCLWLSATALFLAWVIFQVVMTETKRGLKTTITDETIAKYRSPDYETDLDRFKKSMELSKDICDKR